MCFGGQAISLVIFEPRIYDKHMQMETGVCRRKRDKTKKVIRSSHTSEVSHTKSVAPTTKAEHRRAEVQAMSSRRPAAKQLPRGSRLRGRSAEKVLLNASRRRTDSLGAGTLAAVD